MTNGYTLETSAIWADVQDILDNKEVNYCFRLASIYHTPAGDFQFIKVISVDTERNYIKRAGEHIRFQAVIGLGDYVYRLLPYKTNLEVSVKRTPLDKDGAVMKNQSSIEIERYKAIFDQENNPNYNMSDFDRVDIETLNKQDIVTVNFQLIDRSLEPLLLKTVSGVYRKTTPEKLIFNLMMSESDKILVDGKKSVDGIDIYPADNTVSRDVYSIAEETRLIDLTTYIQYREGGVYNADIGTFLQRYKNKKLWFIFPLWNTDRFSTKKEKLVIYSIPQDRLTNTNVSYQVDGSVVKILAVGSKKYFDDAENKFINEGVGFKMIDARSMANKPVEITENGIVGNRTRLNYEVAIKQRDDGLNKANFGRTKVSSNPFIRFSEINKSNIARFDFEWVNCDIRLIYPGMPCRIMSISENKLVEIDGIVGFVAESTQINGQGINNNVYKSNATVTVLCQRYQKTPTIPETDTYGDFYA